MNEYYLTACRALFDYETVRLLHGCRTADAEAPGGCGCPHTVRLGKRDTAVRCHGTCYAFTRTPSVRPTIRSPSVMPGRSVTERLLVAPAAIITEGDDGEPRVRSLPSFACPRYALADVWSDGA